jgi:hypothetical protein
MHYFYVGKISPLRAVILNLCRKYSVVFFCEKRPGGGGADAHCLTENSVPVSVLNPVQQEISKMTLVFLLRIKRFVL